LVGRFRWRKSKSSAPPVIGGFHRWCGLRAAHGRLEDAVVH
jgi:hypothetical protein